MRPSQPSASGIYKTVKADIKHLTGIISRKASTLPKEDKSGLYLTVSLHLVVLIVMLISQISSALKHENTFLLDFSAMEQAERESEETEFRESISDRIDELLGAIPYPAQGDDEEIRNIAVDAGGNQLKDDRNTDVEQLYRDAERLAQELKSGAFAPEQDSDESFASIEDKRVSVSEAPVYSGPSVVSYSVDGRKAVTLSVPAYRCLGGGDVTVRITVEQSGAVVNAEIMEEQSSDDRCLREYAKRAARLSRFTASGSAPKRQFGTITYRFIAQ